MKAKGWLAIDGPTVHRAGVRLRGEDVRFGATLGCPDIRTSAGCPMAYPMPYGRAFVTAAVCCSLFNARLGTGTSTIFLPVCKEPEKGRNDLTQGGSWGGGATAPGNDSDHAPPDTTPVPCTLNRARHSSYSSNLFLQCSVFVPVLTSSWQHHPCYILYPFPAAPEDRTVQPTTTPSVITCVLPLPLPRKLSTWQCAGTHQQKETEQTGRQWP